MIKAARHRQKPDQRRQGLAFDKLDPVKLPIVIDTFELVNAAVGEAEAGSRDQVSRELAVAPKRRPVTSAASPAAPPAPGSSA